MNHVKIIERMRAMNKNYSGEIDRFIYEICYSRIWEAVSVQIAARPTLF